jgi:uncharacterized protein
MPISLYDATVRPFIQTVGAVSAFLDKGLKHFQETGQDPDAIVETRLCADMLPFRFQLVSVAHHSRGAVEGAMAGAFRPPTGIGELGYVAMQAHVAEALAALKALTPEEVNALEGRDVAFHLGQNVLPFTAEGFLLSFSMPNVHFHATTAYDILRQAGVPLGKRDYMGGMRLKT